ncbi:Formin-like protein [Vigna angularis]|uniref:Formin-like protein n=1 Tax=Phaseolus angularis TaxID=3914 RepID=A0A8T0JNI4_PHAAN|nr:Formin-like protein [Vigna angularis]
MQAIIRGLEKVKEELTASENDGPVTEVFRKKDRCDLCVFACPCVTPSKNVFDFTLENPTVTLCAHGVDLEATQVGMEDGTRVRDWMRVGDLDDDVVGTGERVVEGLQNMSN